MDNKDLYRVSEKLRFLFFQWLEVAEKWHIGLATPMEVLAAREAVADHLWKVGLEFHAHPGDGETGGLTGELNVVG